MANFNDGHVSFRYPTDWSVHKDTEFGQIFVTCSEAIAGSDLTVLRIVIQYAAEAIPDPGDLDLGNDMLKSAMSAVNDEKDMPAFGALENFSGRSVHGVIGGHTVTGFSVHVTVPTPFEEDFLNISGVVISGHYTDAYAESVASLVASLKIT
jgi:hypothetical protein